MEFTPGPSTMGTPRYGCAATLLDERRALVVGGWDGRRYLETTEILDLETMRFSPGPELTNARMGAALIKLDARRVPVPLTLVMLATTGMWLLVGVLLGDMALIVCSVSSFIAISTST